MHEPLNMMEDTKKDQFVIKGLVEHSVTSIKEIFERLKKGEMNRHYAETFMNHSSSRSHTIFRITVKGVTNNYIRNFRKENKGHSNINIHNLLEQDEDDEAHHGTVVTESYLNFVDLAGSERIGSHMNWIDDEGGEPDLKNKTKGVQDNRIKEGRSINKSLFFLTQVISLKAEGKSNQYIPFRNSPLTKILRSSLGGNFRTLVVLCVNPCKSQVEISLSTMRFGQNAKKIQNSIQANIVTNNNDESIKILIENYEKKMRDLQAERDEDSLRYQQYFVMIDELRLQRSILLERLEQANKKLSIHIADEISEKDLYYFFKQAKSKVAVMKQSGLLFVPESQQKYDNLHHIEGEDHHNDSETNLKSKFEKEMKVTSKEFVNKFALQAYNNVKSKFEDLKETSEKHQEYLRKLCESFKTVVDFMGHMSNLGGVYLEKLNLMSEQYQDEYLLANERQLKLDIYERYKGFSLLSDKDLEKLKIYIKDFKENLKSELDRREILKGKDPDFPKDIMEGLEDMALNEQDEQERKLKTIKNNIENFVQFREGCASEIEYYNTMYQDFTVKNQLETKSKEIDNFMNTDLIDFVSKVKIMDENLRINDSQLEVHGKKNLDKKLAEYQTKFEKLVGVVLAQNKQAKNNPNKVKEDVSMNDTSSISSIQHSQLLIGNASPRRPSVFKRSSTATAEELVTNSEPGKDQNKNPEKKIRAWLTLKQIEEEPLNYDCMMKDDEEELRSVRQKNMKNDDEMSERSIKVGHNQLKDMKMSQFSYNKSKTVISDTHSHIGFNDVKRFEERRSFIGGRSPQDRNQADFTPIGERFSLRNDDGKKTRFNDLSESQKKQDDKSLSINTTTKNLPGSSILVNKNSRNDRKVHIKDDNNSSSYSSESGLERENGHLDENNGKNRKSRKDSPLIERSKEPKMDFKGPLSSKSNVNSPAKNSRGRNEVKLNILKTGGGGVPMLTIPQNKNELSKDAERSQRVKTNHEKERVSYKSVQNKDNQDLVSMDGIDLGFESPKNNHSRSQKTVEHITPDMTESIMVATESPSKISKEQKRLLPNLSVSPKPVKNPEKDRKQVVIQSNTTKTPKATLTYKNSEFRASTILKRQSSQSSNIKPSAAIPSSKQVSTIKDIKIEPTIRSKQESLSQQTSPSKGLSNPTKSTKVLPYASPDLKLDMSKRRQSDMKTPTTETNGKPKMKNLSNNSLSTPDVEKIRPPTDSNNMSNSKSNKHTSSINNISSNTDIFGKDSHKKPAKYNVSTTLFNANPFSSNKYIRK